MRRWSRLALLLFATGCHGGAWEQRRIGLPTPIQPSDVVSIWSGGKVEKWHAVVITPDSVSGIPSKVAIDCDHCRLSMPVARVDSMTLGYKTRAPTRQGFAKTSLEMGGVVVAGLLLEYLLCSAIGAKNDC